MVLTSFSMEEYEQTIRDESYHEGVEVGLQRGEKLGIHKGLLLAKKAHYLKKQECSIEKIAEELQLSVEEVRELLEE